MKRQFNIIVGLILFVAIGIVFLILFMSGRSQGSKSINIETDKAPLLALTSFRQIRGTQDFLAEVINASDSSLFEYGSARWFEFGEGSGQVRNLVFLNADTLTSQKLFETNNSFVMDVMEFPSQTHSSNSENLSEDVLPVEWFVYEVIHVDTNLDGALDRTDGSIIAVSNADGSGYTELIFNLTKLYNVIMAGGNEVMVVYQLPEGRYASKINLAIKAISITEPLPDLGNEVK